MLKAALVYFALVFSVGFLLGTVRVLYIVPRVGVRTAELSESPLMLLATIFVARWVCRKFCKWREPIQSVGVGLIAVVLLLAADLIVGVGLRGMSSGRVFTERDPVSGFVYYGLLCVFAFMPWFFGRRLQRSRGGAA